MTCPFFRNGGLFHRKVAEVLPSQAKGHHPEECHSSLWAPRFERREGGCPRDDKGTHSSLLENEYKVANIKFPPSATKDGGGCDV